MANQTINVLQQKTAKVTYADAGGNPIPAGGTVVWSVNPPNALTLGHVDDSAQTCVITGQTAGTGAVLSAKEPISGVTGTITLDVLPVQMSITSAVIIVS